MMDVADRRSSVLRAAARFTGAFFTTLEGWSIAIDTAINTTVLSFLSEHDRHVAAGIRRPERNGSDSAAEASRDNRDQ